MKCFLCLLTTIALASACGDDDSTSIDGGSCVSDGTCDGGTALDGGDEADASIDPDASIESDGGQEVDGSSAVDGGVETDGGRDDDAGSEDDAGVDAEMVVPCDRNGYVAVAEDAVMLSGRFLYVAQDTLDEPVTTLNVELITASGGADAPGTYTIQPDGYDTCTNCILVYSDCNASLSDCDKVFLAQSGMLTITEFGDSGGQFAGTLADVELLEVTIDSGTLASTLVPGGERWCIGSYDFGAPVQ